MTSINRIHLHHVESFSQANGPGVRTVIWTQGCNLNCPGCFNPDTHNQTGGYWVDTSVLAKKILANASQIEGITISGGEPLLQLSEITRLLQLIKQQAILSVVLFSGFTWKQLQSMPGIQQLLNFTDVLLAGPYLQEEHHGKKLLGSSNKTTHFLTNRYQDSDFRGLPPAEVTITRGGEIHLSGINPIIW